MNFERRYFIEHIFLAVYNLLDVWNKFYIELPRLIYDCCPVPGVVLTQYQM